MPPDADVGIAKTATEAAKCQVATRIGNDTDLQVPILYYVNTKNKNVFFRSDKANSRDIYDINNLRNC